MAGSKEKESLITISDTNMGIKPLEVNMDQFLAEKLASKSVLHKGENQFLKIDPNEIFKAPEILQENMVT